MKLPHINLNLYRWRGGEQSASAFPPSRSRQSLYNVGLFGIFIKITMDNHNGYF